jgi:GT2 family glycosyltransferase
MLKRVQHDSLLEKSGNTMKNTIDLSIIIVNYNAKDFLRECVQSILREISPKVSYEIIVVDNASTDGSVQMIAKEFPEVHLIASKENLGFSKGNNAGIKKSSGRYVLFLNPDTVMKKDTMESMIEFMDETPKAGAATCFVRMQNGKLDDGAHRGFPTPWNAFCYFSGLAKLFPGSTIFNGYNGGWKDLDKIHEIDALVGAFMLVRREAGEDVGWWDEDYFFYGEDLDFCFELKARGWKIYFVPTVEILHHKGVSAGIKKHSEHISTADSDTKVRATQARFTAMKIFYTKHYLKKYPRLLTWLVFQGIDFKLRRSLRKIG